MKGKMQTNILFSNYYLKKTDKYLPVKPSLRS